MSARSPMPSSAWRRSTRPIPCCRTREARRLRRVGSAGRRPGRARSGGDFRPPPHWDAWFAFSDAGSSYEGPDHGQYSDLFEQLFGQAARAQRRQGALAGGNSAGGPARPHRTGHCGRVPRRHAHHPPAHGAPGRWRPRGARAAQPGSEDSLGHARRPADPPGGPGQPGLGGAPAGDLFWRYCSAPTRAGVPRAATSTSPAARPWEAALGASVEVQTPAGSLEVTVPAGSTPGASCASRAGASPAARRATCTWSWASPCPGRHRHRTRRLGRPGQGFSHFNPRQAQAAQGA